MEQVYNTNNEHPVTPQTGDNLSQYDSQAKYDEAFKVINDEINQNISFANESNDWREIRNRLNISKDKLKGIFLKDEDNTKMLDLINSGIESVNKRQAEEIEKIEKESFDNYNNVIDKVKDSVEKSKELKDFKQAREALMSAQDLFKHLRLRRSHKDELIKIINDAFDSLTNRQIEERENYEMECIENYHNLKGLVEHAVGFSKNSPIYAKSREALIKVQNEIKGKKLKRDQREELFQSIRTAFEAVNSKQDEERNSFDGETSDNFNKLKKIVDEAIAFAQNTEEFSVAREQLINAQSAIKGVKLKREQRDDLYAQIRTVFDELNSKQSVDRTEYESECNENYAKLTQKVDDCFALVLGVTDFKLIRESMITVQSEVKIAKLKKEQRSELFSRIREAFSQFDKKKDEFFSKRREERKSKLGEIKDNLVEKLNRFQELLNKDIEQLEVFKKKIEEANDNEVLVNDLNNRITAMNARINDKNKNIEDTNARIQDIDKEIAENQ
ncbi:MAG TPA: DUF3945 domain-containing protein [Candidatus Kapabacteria bacterium]|nr:DUF3945 domain-containing protein [Candidatus Kapabacteria bacterium]